MSLSERRYAGEFIIREAERTRSREAVTVLSGQNLVAGAVLGRVVATSVTQEYSGTGGGLLTMDATTPLLAGVQEGTYEILCIEPASAAGLFTVRDPNGVVLGTHTVAGAAFANQIKFAIADGTPDFAAGDLFKVHVKAGTMSKISGTGDGAVTLYRTMAGSQLGTYVLTGATEAANGGTFTAVAPDGTTIGTVTVGTRFTAGGLDLLVADGSADWDIGDIIHVVVTRGKVKAWNPTNIDGSAKAWGVLFAPVDATSADKRGVALARDAEIRAADLAWASGLSNAQKASGLAELAARNLIAR